jgi:hypothetical protein
VEHSVCVSRGVSRVVRAELDGIPARECRLAVKVTTCNNLPPKRPIYWQCSCIVKGVHLTAQSLSMRSIPRSRLGLEQTSIQRGGG